jgi:hypothetical protein
MSSKVIQIQKFLSAEMITSLCNLFFSNKELVKKPTGPTTLDISKIKSEDQIERLFERIYKQLGSFEVLGGNFYHTSVPYVVHCDNMPDENGLPSFNIILPLLEEFSSQEQKDHFVVLFEQSFRGAARKFFFNDTNVPMGLYPHQYDDKGVLGIVSGTPEQDNPLLSHLKQDWLAGLSVAENMIWSPGNLLAFQGSRLHCSSNFSDIGLLKKLGLALFIRPREPSLLFCTNGV